MGFVVGLASSDLLSLRWSLLVVNAGLLCAALAATLACWITAGQHSGAQFWWRLWMGAGACGWLIGELLWSWYWLFGGVNLPSPSLADAGYLALPVFAFAAIITLAGDRLAAGALRRPSRNLVMVLDGLIVVGALFVLTWTTARSVVRAGATTPLAYAVAIAYPVSDLLLTVLVILLIAGASSAANRLQLIVLGSGLFCLAFTDSVFAYRVSAGAHSMPPLAGVGDLAGLALVGVAALTPTRETPRSAVSAHAHWGHLLLPYVPVAGTGVLFIVQLIRGIPMDSVEIVIATVVIALLLIRQGLTLVESAGLVASRARLVLATDRTRRQLERDLHDGVQQRLISLALAVRRAEGNVPPELAQLRQQLSAVVAGLNGTADDVRELSRGVHPAILTEGGLRPALRALARRSAVPVELDVPVNGRQPEPVEVAAYYVVAEALTNAAKYSQATRVRVCVQPRDRYVYLSVRDDGVGGADPKRGTGLTGLTDRVEALGGKLTVESPAGQGTRIEAEFPLQPTPARRE
ncbi:sensor histidine kinase [Dactylosporangium sp. CA-233914]|uniref:sensor histidine kinase n=1 Tax=Dactylosporangium sp. CA-233914 TaxID=3239934 RepID=UPI003D8D808E